jgi:hypothetical protein
MPLEPFEFTYNLITESSQSETLNAVKNSREVLPVPVSCFFSDSTLCNQLETGAYGPVATDPVNKFRLTSVFECQGIKKVYAPVAGRIFIQPNPENDKVNVLIKPFGSISGLKIKYFIFRGLNNNDFFESTIKVRKLSNTSSPSSFLTRIWSTYNYWNPNQEDNFHPKFLGYDLQNQPITNLIEKEFFKASENLNEKPFELFSVLEGEWIGNFTDKLGVEIILDEGDFVDDSAVFKFDLDFLRQSEVVLNMNDYATNFKKKRIRETIFKFIEPAAFYGFHVENGTVKQYNGETLNKYKGLEIYTHIIDKFYNKNKIYIYLKSNKNRSYNYYSNYNNELKIGSDKNNLPLASYLTSSWPVLIYNTPQTNSEDLNKIYLKLVCDTDGNNNNKCFYNVLGNLKGDRDGNWAYGGMKSICNEGDSYTNEIEYHFKNVEINSQKHFISNVVFAIYIGKLLPTLNEPTDSQNNLKDKFHLINSNPLFSVEEKPVIEEQFSSNLSFNSSDEGFKQMLNNKYILDTDTNGFKLSIETMVADYDTIYNESNFQIEGYINKSTEINTNKSSFKFKDYLNSYYKLESPYFLNKEKKDINGIEIICISLNILDNNLFKKHLICFTKDLKEEIYNYLTLNHIDNASVYLKFINTENNIHKYQIKIVGENSNNQYEYFDFNTTIPADAYFYSLDKLVFFTKKYTANLPENTIDSIIEFQDTSVDNFNLNLLTKRITTTAQNPTYCKLYDLKGYEINYNNDKDYYGTVLTGSIKIPVGTRVIHLGKSKNNINGIEMAYVVFFHSGKFREGFVDKTSLGNPNIRVNSQEVIANNSLHVDSFLDDANLIINYNEKLTKNSHSVIKSKEFTILINETISLYNDLINFNGKFILNSKLVSLNSTILNNNNNLSLLPVNNNRIETMQKFINFEGLKKIADKDMSFYNGTYLLNPITNLWIEYWKVQDTAFNNFLNQNITINVGQETITYNYQILTTDEYYETNGTVFTKRDNLISYSKLIYFLNAIRNHLLGQNSTPITQTPEAQWLINTNENQLLNFTKIITIDENLWNNQNLKYAGFVTLDDSIGYLNSSSCFSLFLHEMNTNTFSRNLFYFDTHGYDSEIIINSFNNLTSLMRNNGSCIEYFNYYSLNTIKNQGNWLLFITSFHKSILYLNYYIKNLL